MKKLLSKMDRLMTKVDTANKFQKNTFGLRVEISNDPKKDMFICKASPTEDLRISTELSHSTVGEASIRFGNNDKFNVFNIELFLDNYKLVDEAIDALETKVDYFLIDEMDKINKLVKGKEKQ